jgi:hypothetical protein
LWAGVDSPIGRDDERRIALAQLLPATGAPEGGSETAPAGRKSLFAPIWLLTLALFVAERWLSAQPRRARA